MSSKMQTVTTEKLINASTSLVYQAFTNATLLKEWLCDVATVSAKPGGRMYLWWNGDFYSSGEYVSLEPDHSVAFQWFGRGESVPTQVTVTLVGKDNGTLVTMAHTLPAGKEWLKIAQGFKHEWTVSLENLASVLETGQDRRIFDRPLLGIDVGDFSPEQAKRLGVPVTTGVRLDDVREGLGAQAAGLKANDVLVSLCGVALSDFGSLISALRGKKGGDKVKVVYYRGPKKKTVTMELSRRPIPDVPFNIPELARRVRLIHEERLSALAEAFRGVSEEEAAFQPGSNEWSAKEVLGHLILGDQFFPNYYLSIFQGQEIWSDGYSGNSHELTRATVAAFPTVADLLEQLHRLSNLLVAFVESWPAEYLARKSSYFRVAQILLEDQGHTQSHIKQIQEAIAAARKK